MRMRLAAVVFALAVFALAPPAHGQDKDSATVPSETPAGQLLAEYLDLCSAPALDRLTAWNAAHVSPRILTRWDAASLARDDVRQCTQSGVFQVNRVLASEPDHIEILAVSPRSGAWLTVRLGLDEDGRIIRRGVRPHEPPESALPAVPDEATLARLVEVRTAALAEAGVFSGIVEIARGDVPIVTVSAGFANRETGREINGSTQFTIASMGKLFTAVAVGQLVDQGRIAFSDTVGRFFPEYANETVRREVTVGMLLAHTAGMGDFLVRRSPKMMIQGVERAAEFIPLYENDEPQFEPGTEWAYSNAGFALAGAIVEQVSGVAYPEYLRRHVFDPAGMTNSDPNNIPRVDPDLVIPYTRWVSEDGEWQVAERNVGNPAGGAISTADDLIRFAHAVRSGALVSRETLEEMTTPRVMDEYGYAMQIQDVYGRTVVGHGGLYPGVSTSLSMLLDSPYTVVVLANQDPPAEEHVRRYAVPLVMKLTTPTK